MAITHSITMIKTKEDRAIYRAVKILEDRLRAPGMHISSPGDVRRYLLLQMAELEREVFVCLFLDASGCLIASEEMFSGSLTESHIYSREIVKRTLYHNAAAVIFAHNHPSGKTAIASEADKYTTRSLQQLLKLIDVKVHDHFIVAGTNTLSFYETGLLLD